ncbi:hypothetical protein GGR50DRAFT_656488, partial [Xylaria sp. CBS 124048]
MGLWVGYFCTLIHYTLTGFCIIGFSYRWRELCTALFSPWVESGRSQCSAVQSVSFFSSSSWLVSKCDFCIFRLRC